MKKRVFSGSPERAKKRDFLLVFYLLTFSINVYNNFLYYYNAIKHSLNELYKVE